MTLLSVTDYGKFNSVSCYNGPLASHYQTRPEKQHGKEKEEERIAQMKRKREEEEEEETNDIESISTHMTVAMKAGEKDRTPSGMSSDNTGFKGVGDKTRPGVRFSEDIMVKTEELSEKSDIKIGPDQKDTCKSEQTWIKGYGICSQANNIPQGILPLTQWKDHINPFSTLLIKKEDSQLTDDVEDEDMSEEILIEQFRKFIKKKEMNVQFIVKKLKDLENELSELKVDYKDLLNDSNSVIERLKNELKYCKDELRMAVEAKNKAEEITKDSENHNNKGLVIKDGQLEKVKIELKQLRSQLEDKNVLVKSLEEERTKILSSLGQAHMDKESLRKELEVVKGNRNREDREIRKVMVSPENGNFHRQHRSTGIEHASKEKEKKKKDVNPIDLSADLDD
ncbi:uncharacterized protein L201_003919 [Kwoniella dendrophila CBS 6074]|uniref:Hyaluronan-mediated motility receptor C-terminal domain-containing protein n=1 Tax=Kwoniella dendrophila CBS 6074 TaxID=1295534 RepID=A0AAX4JUG9_9TREE